MGADDLSKESENPVTRLITLPLRYEAEFLDGATKSTKDTFEIDQAVVPFRLNDDWSVFRLGHHYLIDNKAGIIVDAEGKKSIGPDVRLGHSRRMR